MQKQERLAWRLDEIAKATGLSVAFLRKQDRESKLPTKRVGGAVLVLDSDLRRWLEQGDKDAA
jgi:hypothetical protein